MGPRRAGEQLQQLANSSSWPRTTNSRTTANEASRRMGGVGISLAMRQRTRSEGAETFVDGIISGFPAQECGQIQIGDVLVKVDRLKLTRATKLQDVNTLIRGMAGTHVELTFMDAARREKAVSLVRVAQSKQAGQWSSSP